MNNLKVVDIDLSVLYQNGQEHIEKIVDSVYKENYNESEYIASKLLLKSFMLYAFYLNSTCREDYGVDILLQMINAEASRKVIKENGSLKYEKNSTDVLFYDMLEKDFEENTVSLEGSYSSFIFTKYLREINKDILEFDFELMISITKYKVLSLVSLL